MKAAHPNQIRAALFAAVVYCIALGGCRSQPGMAVNPFLSPDRVPPPATRTLLPGQAQPYYPGDPLPVMQSATPQTPSTDAGLARNSTNGSGPAANLSNSSTSLASLKEATVAIPADSAALRFAAPQAAEPVPPNALANASPNAAAQSANQQTVVPAAYYQASGNTPTSKPEFAPQVIPPAVSSPFRPPQVTVAQAQIANGRAVAPHNPVAQSGGAVMGVNMRAVPSPALSTAPRIRLPGYAPAQTVMVGPAYGTIVQPAFGRVLQTVQTTPAVPTTIDGRTDLVALPPANAISADGFRPRGSMR
jgi:hypothetical protein